MVWAIRTGGGGGRKQKQTVEVSPATLSTRRKFEIKITPKNEPYIFKQTDIWLYIITLPNVHTIANSHPLSSGLFATCTSRSRWCYVHLKRNGVQYCEISGVCIYHWTRSCYSREGFTKRVTIHINVCIAATNFSQARCIYAHAVVKTDINTFLLLLIHVAPRNTSKRRKAM